MLSNFYAMIGGRPGDCQPCRYYQLNSWLQTNFNASSPSAAILLKSLLSAMLFNIYREMMKTSCSDSEHLLVLQRVGSVLRPGSVESLGCRDERLRFGASFCSTRLTQHNQQGTISAFYSTNMAEDSYQTLLTILRERDVPYDREAIKAAFNDPESQTAIQAWIQEYLTPETLLTRDEAAL
jgi:hypothetical protein